jgi:arylsulfatase A-like enzyme
MKTNIKEDEKRSMLDYTRRDFLKTVGVGTASLAMSGCTSTGLITGAERKQPNILVFFTDDQRFDTIRALGNKHIITPNTDSLVRNGTTFTNAYIMGSMSGAVCVPSRAMLMSGRTLFGLEGKGNTIPEEHRTMPEVLRKAGYTTFHTGKWHQDKKAFSRCFSSGGKIFFGGMGNHWNVPVNDFDAAGNYPRNQRYKGDKHSSELFSDAAVRFLRDHKDDKPFFVYVAYTAPHDPRHMPKKYEQMYNPEKIVLPKSFLPEHSFDNGEMRIRDEKLAAWPRTPKEIRKHIADYYAMITHMDAQIGRVLSALKKTGKAKNTIIVFAGDNGLAVGRHGLLGKQSLYEHSVHVPLIISGPGIPKGQKRDAFCYLLDIFPTLCDLTGMSIPKSVEGRSLIGIIRDRRRKVRETLFFAYKDVHRGVRNERYKLIEYAVKGKRTTQLFDLQTDPWEINNLADKPGYAAHLKRLRKELLRWKDKLGDSSKFWQGYISS